MKKRVVIVLPGKIGDVIICLPIAKFYFDLGYEVYWTVWSDIGVHFEGRVDYVQFIKVDRGPDCMAKMFGFASLMEARVIDLSFTNDGCWENENSRNYLTQNQYSFDEFRYQLAGVPFENKWNLEFKRDMEGERKLKEQFIPQGEMKYTLCQFRSSDYSVDLQLDLSVYDGLVLEIIPASTSVLDWVGLLEGADQLVLVESCFTNLVDQLGIQNKRQYLLTKKGYYGDALSDGRLKGMPVLRNSWVML